MFVVVVVSKNSSEMTRRTSNMRKLLVMTGCVLLVFLAYKHYISSNDHHKTVSMKKLLAISMALAKRGGERLWSIRKGHSSGDKDLDSKVKGKTKEGANELLTRGDMESHHIIYSGLKAAFPDLKVFYFTLLCLINFCDMGLTH